jgi:hypothetical protein
MEKVMTSLGEHPKENCRFINGEYYLIGDINVENSGDVYLINNRFVRFVTGKIVFNHSVNQYQLRNSSIVEGVVKFDGNEAVKGFFDPAKSNLTTIITLLNGERLYAIDETKIPLSYREVISKGEYAHISKYEASDFIKLKSVSQKYKESLSYDSKGITDRYSENFRRNYNPKISADIEKYAKSIGDLTFGLEFETVKGVIPDNKLAALPLIPLRDGSIQGLEYVTIPLSGKIGIQAVIDSVKELEKRTEYDDSCALHLHIGNVPRTPEFITAFYKLISHHQDEMFSMFPLYKKYNFGVKRKSYSKPFPVNLINPQIHPNIDVKNRESIIAGFTPIFDYLAESATFAEYGNDLNNVGGHPRDPGGNAKWNINTRYYAVNFIPLIFGNHQTIEFRIHTPTYDIAKILDFLFMCSYLINYTIKNTSKILSNPKFLNSRNLSQLLVEHVINGTNVDNSTKTTLSSEMENYVYSRINSTYKQNSEGNVRGDENKIRFNTYLNLNGLHPSKPLEIAKGVRRDNDSNRESRFFSKGMMPKPKRTDGARFDSAMSASIASLDAVLESDMQGFIETAPLKFTTMGTYGSVKFPERKPNSNPLEESFKALQLDLQNRHAGISESIIDIDASTYYKKYGHANLVDKVIEEVIKEQSTNEW